jgi:hypothetical protein
MTLGQRSVQKFVKVVKRTITVNEKYAANYSQQSVGKVLSKQALIKQYNVPAYISVDLPDYPSSVAGRTITDANTGLVFNFGYLETGTERQGVGNSRVQITTSWVYNKWAAIAYDFVS